MSKVLAMAISLACLLLAAAVAEASPGSSSNNLVPAERFTTEELSKMSHGELLKLVPAEMTWDPENQNRSKNCAHSYFSLICDLVLYN
jgi:hypothetical protein